MTASRLRRLCVFCGSAPGNDPRYLRAATATGEELARRGIDLVYGGGSVGVMGAVAAAVLAGGGEVDGVIPRQLLAREHGDPGVTRLHLVDSMHERKQLMGELCDGYLTLPGGLGTLEELFEVATWSQLGIHAKPVGVLNVAGYYGPLTELLDRAVDAAFLSPDNRARILIGADLGELLDAMTAWDAPPTAVWMDAGDT